MEIGQEARRRNSNKDKFLHVLKDVEENPVPLSRLHIYYLTYSYSYFNNHSRVVGYL